MLTILHYGQGRCTWCLNDTDDGVQAKFKDGLEGFFCRKHFWHAVKARAELMPVKEPTSRQGATHETK